MSEHDLEPVRGLPEILPAGERMIWQGEPDWHSLARRVFHVRKVTLYFGLIMAATIATKLFAGASLEAIAVPLSWQLTLAASAIGILYFIAWLYARTTVYTITSERLVMRFGVALPMMVNIPWSKISGVDLLAHGDGTGDIAFTVDPTRRTSYLLFWPQVRPWRFSPVTPAVRCISGADSVAADLAQVLQHRVDHNDAETITAAAAAGAGNGSPAVTAG
jgi:hypothetical protein